ncbi:MAG: hypothetical protein VKK04_07655 [Synechococcales bacterium]|nr:hypothetical protein [Synechococcales bacterium]
MKSFSPIALGWCVTGLLLIGCNSVDSASSTDGGGESLPPIVESIETEPEAAPPPTAPPVEEATSSIPTDLLISAEGIGAATLGMTLETLKQTMGPETEFVEESSFMVDFDAIAVRRDGEVLFYILHLAGEPLTEDGKIQGLLTTNPAFRTAAGVGVGVPIAAAENLYGDATLSYHTANESREYVRFASHPGNNISFGTGGGGAGATDFAGIYPAQSGEYYEASDYRQDATIQTVLVVCLARECSG